MEIPNELLEILHKVRKVVVLTGAGVSAESGIATFRDPNGLWTKMNPAELASVQGFMSNPKLVWSWYEHRRDIISSTKPNPGHYSIAEMQEIFTDFTLITQNVDRLHQAAGSKNVIELHGNIIDNHCQKCKKPFKGETSLPDEELPKCPECGGMIRPSVVWFGENLPLEALSSAEDAAESCEVFFSVGTSAEVYPAAALPIKAKQCGAVLIEVNPNQTALTKYADFRLEAPSGVALPILLEKLKKI
ncbi:MAG TPA: NAD-dependent deacylase [Candidatus Kapabacteria bacterium]|nr:NAD-dependent deacylase [Candidatus Kapabacteria bacterium]